LGSAIERRALWAESRELACKVKAMVLKLLDELRRID
jgi:hypothetical protein